MKFTVYERIIKCTNENLIGDNADYKAEFTFDSEWDGQIKTARFIHNGKHVDVLLENDKCIIPVEVLKQGFLKVGVFAGDKTTSYCEIYVKASIKEVTGNVAKPTPDVYAQIMDMLGKITYLTEEEVQKITAEYVESHKEELKGEDGYTPVKGIDYWTDEDKAEIKEYCRDFIGSDAPAISYTAGYRDEVIIPDKYSTGCSGELTTWREYFGYDETQTTLYITSAIQNTYGTVYENIDFPDVVVTINKANLKSMTFRNCRFSTEAPYAVNTGSNLDTENVHVAFENCEFLNQTSACVQPTKNFSMLNCKIHGMGSDGGKEFDNGFYKNCYFYDIGFKDGSHADGIQITSENSNFEINNCRFDVPSYEGHASNAAILSLITGNSYNATIKDCVMTGGNYTFYYGYKDPSAGLVIENNVVENIVAGCSYQFGVLNDNSQSFDYTEVKEADKLFVSSVYQEDGQIKLLVTNYTNMEKNLILVTDKGETTISVPACPLYEEGLAYTDFADFPFDIEVATDGNYVVCYDTEITEENQIRYVNFSE